MMFRGIKSCFYCGILLSAMIMLNVNFVFSSSESSMTVQEKSLINDSAGFDKSDISKQDKQDVEEPGKYTEVSTQETEGPTDTDITTKDVESEEDEKFDEEKFEEVFKELSRIFEEAKNNKEESNE